MNILCDFFKNFRSELLREQCVYEFNSLCSDKTPTLSTLKYRHNDFNRGYRLFQDEFREDRIKLVPVPENIDSNMKLNVAPYHLMSITFYD